MKQVIFCHFNLVMNILYNHLYRTEGQTKHLADAIPSHIQKNFQDHYGMFYIQILFSFKLA